MHHILKVEHWNKLHAATGDLKHPRVQIQSPSLVATESIRVHYPNAHRILMKMMKTANYRKIKGNAASVP